MLHRQPLRKCSRKKSLLEKISTELLLEMLLLLTGVVLDEEVLVVVLAEEVVREGQAIVLPLTHFFMRA